MSSPAQVIVSRNVRFPFDESIPRHWMPGDALATHVGNGFNLLFPAAERFIIKSVRCHESALEDPELRAQVRGFVAQEANHSREHEGFLRILEKQGFRIGAYLAVQRRVFGALERFLSPRLALAATAATEHYTAIIGEVALRERPFDGAHPTMRDLLMWHAAEEVEHKSVAFDVLRAVDSSYTLRLAGLAVATTTIAVLWSVATWTLLLQDKDISWPSLARRAMFGKSALPMGRLFLAIFPWLRPGFHPASDPASREQAVAYLAGVASGVAS